MKDARRAVAAYQRELDGYRARGLVPSVFARVVFTPEGATALCGTLDIVVSNRADVFYHPTAGHLKIHWLGAPWLLALASTAGKRLPAGLDGLPDTFTRVDHEDVPLIGQWVLSVPTTEARREVEDVFELGGREALREYLRARTGVLP